MNTLQLIQSKIKAPKGQYNSFAKYNYRSAEDIIEAAKPVLAEYNFSLILSDEMVMLGNRYYVKAIVKIKGESEEYEATGYAREAETKKGMDESQITGAASSYARKYALNGLFALDDTKDADTDEHTKQLKAGDIIESKAVIDGKNISFTHTQCKKCGGAVEKKTGTKGIYYSCKQEKGECLVEVNGQWYPTYQS